MNMDFKNQIVLITGSSRGIGRETALLFLEKGAHVIFTGTSQGLPNSLEGIQGSYEYLQADFTTDEGIEEFLNKLVNYNRIDVLVNNAGINRLNEITDISDQEYTEVMSVNVNAPFKVSRSIAAKMKNNRYGRIVNIASIWSVITKPKRTIYTMSKNALIGLTKTMGVELASYGIMVNAISPGFTLTELTKKTLTEDDFDSLASQVPAGRFAEPKEMAQVILFLASKENSYMTCQNITVDGGFTNV
jgi:3-oxoacyl-[acyl-carrier protein] reductase